MSEQTPDPTPEEIQQRCMEIQSEWSEKERLRRIVGGPSNREIERGAGDWEVPTVKTPKAMQQ